MDARKKPFTEFEKSLLINLVDENTDIIENKKTDAVSTQRKSAAWNKVCEQFNTSSRIAQKANVKQLKKFWYNLKAKAREAKTLENQKNYTGGGPAIPDMDPIHAQVLSTIPKLLPVIKVSDSDLIKERSNDDDDSFSWIHVKNRGPHAEIGECSNPTEVINEVEVVTVENCDTEVSQNDSANLDAANFSNMESTQTADKRGLCTSRRRRNTEPASVDEFKKRILEQDFAQRSEKFQLELNHIKKLQEMEIIHKKTMYKLLEEEMKLKIEMIKKKIENA